MRDENLKIRNDIEEGGGFRVEGRRMEGAGWWVEV